MFSYFWGDHDKKNDDKKNDNKKNDDKKNDNQHKEEIVELFIDINDEDKYLLSEEEEVISYGDLNNNDDNIINMEMTETNDMNKTKETNVTNVTNETNETNVTKETKEHNIEVSIPRPRLVTPQTNIVWVSDSSSGSGDSDRERGVMATEANITTDNDQSTLIENEQATFMTNKVLLIGTLCGGATIVFYFATYGFNV